MSDVAIKVEGLGKQYHIGSRAKQFDRLGSQLTDAFVTPIRRAKKLLQGQATGAADLDETIWALRDVSFELKRGDLIGIIGRNGAGKSTLLKILSRITVPTEGKADILGRVGSLLEVGTGFHPELTGRENVYLNGSILGMRKFEIEQKFDEIVEFAEIEKFIDTPVKHYSSGMYVRLAFSVAAHLEPEILLIDEVLAVGDVEFQKKCLGQMDNVAQAGRTILFVSHNMNAIQRLCPQSILLDNGKLVRMGKTKDVIAHYLSSQSYEAAPGEWIDVTEVSRNKGSDEASFVKIRYSSHKAEIGGNPYSFGPVEFSLMLFSAAARSVGSVAVTIYDQYGAKLVNVDTITSGKMVKLEQGNTLVRLAIDKLYLNPGVYVIGLWLANPSGEVFDHIPAAIQFEVVDLQSEGLGIKPKSDGYVCCDFTLIESG